MDQMVGGETVVLDHLAGMRIQEVGDLTQWSSKDVERGYQAYRDGADCHPG